MVFCCGCIYPRPDRVNSLLPESYRLNDEQLLRVQSSLVGLPITYEHKGVFQAVENVEAANKPMAQASVLDELKRLSQDNVTATPIGSITDSCISKSGHLWIMFEVSATKYEGNQTVALNINTNSSLMSEQVWFG